MSSVTGLTAERMLIIEGASVVSGAIDSSGHLILTRHDGTTIDAGYALVAVPDATTTQKGVVELATSAETTALADDTRAITPSGFAPVYNSLDGRIGTLETRVINNHLVTASFNQSTSMTAYPLGTSYMYLSDTESAAGGWEFSGNWGLLTTVKYSTDMIVQNWQRHQGGPNSGYTDLWQRTANSGSGWSTWVRFSRGANDILNSSVTPNVGQWYRIASFTGSVGSSPGPKASAEFIISSTGSGLHTFLRLRASVAYNYNKASLSVEECSGYGFIPMFTKARIVSLNGTNDGHALEIYCGATTVDSKVKIHVKHDNWLQTDNATMQKWSNIGLSGFPSIPISPQTVLMQRGIYYTGDWTAPTLTNGWSNYSTGYAPAGFKMDPGGLIRLEGLVKGGTVSSTGSASAIFTLPEGCRPKEEHICCVMSNNAIARVELYADGKVSALTGSNAWVSLAGITFLAEQ